MLRVPRSNRDTLYYPLRGGEDLSTPSIIADPGRLRFSRNYECDQNGRYRRIDGYERFDGHPKPSEASYWLVYFQDGNEAITAGATVTGSSSGATGILLTSVVESGTYAGGSANGYIVLTGVSGTFEEDENLQVAAVTKAVSTTISYNRGASTDALDNTYLQSAIEAARDNISAVPGYGNILGVWQYNGVKYAFRNNALETACVMYKSSTSGWVECDLGRYRSFTSGGTTEISEEDTITGETSGATAVVKRVVVKSGTWAGGDAAGYMILYDQVGTFVSETVKVGASLNLATISGNSSAQALLPGGEFYFDNFNFQATSNTTRMYGCDGVNTAFEWDGSVFVPIITGMDVDTPTRIKAHKYHLTLAFPGGSWQSSSLGDPYQWSVVTGASSIGIGDDITALESLEGGILGIWGRNSTWLLYGSSIDDWDLVKHSGESGGIAKTVQKISPGIFLDDRGLTTLAATQNYGDFVSNVISKDVQNFLTPKINNVQSSVRCRQKGQYRLFFDDRQGLNLTLSAGKVIGFTRLYYDHLPCCVCSTENSTGQEEIFFGSTDGYVYQLDSGTSFDGSPIKAFFRTHYQHCKSPAYTKRFFKISLELNAPVNTSIKIIPDFSYGETEWPLSEDFSVESNNAVWGVGEWGAFAWNSPVVGSAVAYLDGYGTNIAVTIYSESTYVQPHTIEGIILHYGLRNMKK